jgi:hypothetical protein
MYRNPQYTVMVRATSSPMPPAPYPHLLQPFVATDKNSLWLHRRYLRYKRIRLFHKFSIVRSHFFTKSPPTSRKHIKHYEHCWFIDQPPVYDVFQVHINVVQPMSECVVL